MKIGKKDSDLFQLLRVYISGNLSVNFHLDKKLFTIDVFRFTCGTAKCTAAEFSGAFIRYSTNTRHRCKTLRYFLIGTSYKEGTSPVFNLHIPMNTISAKFWLRFFPHKDIKLSVILYLLKGNIYPHQACADY